MVSSSASFLQLHSFRVPQEVVSRALRVYRVPSPQGHVIETEYHVNMTHRPTASGRGLLLQFNASLCNPTYFLADSHPAQQQASLHPSAAQEQQEQQQHQISDYALSSSDSPVSSATPSFTNVLPLEADYLESATLAIIRGREGLRVSVHAAQPHTVAVHEDGYLSIVLEDGEEEEMSTADDSQESRMAPRSPPAVFTFHLLVERNTSDASFRHNQAIRYQRPSLLSHLVLSQLQNPSLVAVEARLTCTEEQRRVDEAAEEEEELCEGSSWRASLWPQWGCPGALKSPTAALEAKNRTHLPLALLSERFPCDGELASQSVATGHNVSLHLTLHRWVWDCTYNQVTRGDLQCSLGTDSWTSSSRLLTFSSNLTSGPIVNHAPQNSVTPTGGPEELSLGPGEVTSVRIDID